MTRPGRETARPGAWLEHWPDAALERHRAQRHRVAEGKTMSPNLFSGHFVRPAEHPRAVERPVGCTEGIKHRQQGKTCRWKARYRFQPGEKLQASVYVEFHPRGYPPSRFLPHPGGYMCPVSHEVYTSALRDRCETAALRRVSRPSSPRL